MTARLSGGGKRRSARQWQSLLGRFAGSGLSVEAFGRSESISAASFYRWRTALGNTHIVPKATDPTPPAFADLGVLGSAPVPNSRLEPMLDPGGGVVLHRCTADILSRRTDPCSSVWPTRRCEEVI